MYRRNRRSKRQPIDPVFNYQYLDYIFIEPTNQGSYGHDAALPNENSNASRLTPYVIFIKLVPIVVIGQGGRVFMEKHDLTLQSIGDRDISITNGNTHQQNRQLM